MNSVDVLILAYSQDSGVDSVCRLLDHAGVRWERLSTLAEPSQIFSFDPARGTLNTKAGPVPRAKLAWNRRTPFAARRNIDPLYRQFALEEFRQGLVGSLRVVAERWFPEPAALVNASRKPLQLYLAGRDPRLRIPDTIITSDPAAALAFVENHPGGCIVKTLGRPVVEKETTNAVFYTSIVDDRVINSLEKVAHAPVIIQEYIKRQCDIRVTIVGDRVFGTRIDTSCEEAESDWRIAASHDGLSYQTATVDDQTTKACLTMLKSLDLRFGCFDFAVDAAGNWIFLEVNPNGQWYWIELETGAKISEAFAEELIYQTSLAAPPWPTGCLDPACYEERNAAVTPPPCNMAGQR